MRITRRFVIAIAAATSVCGLFVSTAYAEDSAETVADENGRAYYDNAPVLPGTYGVVDKDGGSTGSGLKSTESTELEGGEISPSALKCGDWAVALAPGFAKGWGPTSKGCYVLGKAGVKVGYKWMVNPAPVIGSPIACAQVRGYNSSMKSVWYGAGCGSGNSYSAPWGNVASSKALRAKSAKSLVTRVHWL